VLVGLEEWELLEKAFPGNLVVLAVFHHVFGDFHRLLDFRKHDITSG